MGGIRRDTSVPILKNNNTEAVTNGDKAEMLAKAFVKMHSSENLLNEELLYLKELGELRRIDMCWGQKRKVKAQQKQIFTIF